MERFTEILSKFVFFIIHEIIKNISLGLENFPVLNRQFCIPAKMSVNVERDIDIELMLQFPQCSQMVA